MEGFCLRILVLLDEYYSRSIEALQNIFHSYLSTRNPCAGIILQRRLTFSSRKSTVFCYRSSSSEAQEEGRISMREWHQSPRTGSRPTSGSAQLSPIPPSRRLFSAWDMSWLWFGITINVPSYYLAGSLVDLGMSWWQGIITIITGNTILLLPLILIGHPGTRYGISFPILLCSSFGVRGAHIPALLRALVACGWCGIETWIGGQAIFLLLPSSLKNFSSLSRPLPWLGISGLEFSCFILFWIAQLVILWRGIEGIKKLEKFSSPVLIVLICSLFIWACLKADGFGEMLSTPSRLSPAQFLPVFLPSLTASIGSWAGLALSIADFTRYCPTQADQMFGQLGLPIFMGLFTFVGLTVTSSTEVIYGRIISNPVQLLAEIGGTYTKILAIIGISLSTITTNIPANFVAPANFLVSLSPSIFSFSRGCLVTGIIGIAFQPWRILQSSENYVYTWLVGSSAIIGPTTGILLTDYYFLHSMVLDVNGLYSKDPRGPYYYCGGYNPAALVALVLSVVASVPGFLHKVGILTDTFEAFIVIYDNAWFFGLFSGSVSYWLLCCGWRRRKGSRSSSNLSLLDPLYPDLE